MGQTGELEALRLWDSLRASAWNFGGSAHSGRPIGDLDSGGERADGGVLTGSGFIGRLAVVAGAVAVLTPATAFAQDPGAAEWTPVPRERIAEECGMDPDVLDAAA